MPSPLFHATTGYFLSKYLPANLIPKSYLKNFRFNIFLYAVLVATCADLDFIPQFITGIGFHRGITHSLIFTLIFSLIISWIASKFWRITYQKIFQFTFIVYSSHLILDFFTEGRGIKLFLPFLDQFFKSPILIFPGIHYSRGWFDFSHFIPLIYELLLSAALYGLLSQWQAYQDQKFVASAAKNNLYHRPPIRSKETIDS